MTPVGKFTEAASLLISHSITTIINKKTAVRITNTTEAPYLIKKNSQTAELSVVTREQSKFIGPVDTTILSMIPERDPDLTTYLSESLKTNKPEQQSNTFWFPTPKNSGKTEHHTPIRTRILKELRQLQKKEKLNSKDDVESRMKFLKRFDWTDKMLTETEKHAVEKIPVEYHDIFARHRMDIGMNAEFKVTLTPKEDKAVYSQSLPMPIHLKEDLVVELTIMHKYGIITVLPFSKYASPIFVQRNSDGKLCLRVDLRKINTLIADDYTKNNHPVTQSALCQTQHNTWQGNPYPANLTALKLITVCRWRTNGPWRCLPSILLAERLPTGDIHMVLADLCLSFRASCASTWTQLSRLTNVFNTWMILESQPVMPRTLPGTFGQSSNALAMQD